MKNIIYIAIISIISAATIFAGGPLKGIEIRVGCPDGKFFTAVTNDKGEFSIKNAEFKCDNPVVGITYQKIEMTSKKITIENDDNNKSITSPRDAASGLPTGKRTHKPLKLQEIVFTGDLDGDGTADKVHVNLSSDGTIITGKVWSPANFKWDLKQNKN